MREIDKSEIESKPNINAKIMKEINFNRLLLKLKKGTNKEIDKIMTYPIRLAVKKMTLKTATRHVMNKINRYCHLFDCSANNQSTTAKSTITKLCAM